MAEFSWLTGCTGDNFKLYINWHDHNNCRHETILEARIDYRDKPRTLIIEVNNNQVAEIICNNDKPISDIGDNTIINEMKIRKL